MTVYDKFDRSELKVGHLNERNSKTDLSVMIDPDSQPISLSEEERQKLVKIARDIYERGPAIVAYGAHLIKNGCAPLLIRMIEQGYVKQMITNGAGMIHDFEFAFQGKTEEDVEQGLQDGQFGLWDETGRIINSCINEAYENNTGKGGGESVGGLISKTTTNKQYSVLGRSYEMKIPAGIMKAFGQDIIDTHPSFDGAAWGKAAQIDFDIFAKTIQGLQGGMFLSIGSAVMSPMVFEKALSMARNTTRPENFHIVVNDIQPSNEGWSQREPGKENPAYFSRFNKTFSRAAKACNSQLTYVQLDNRAFLHNLYSILTNF